MEPFLGEVRLFAGIFAPSGWNYCDGTILSIAENDALFSLIGTTYGGDGVTNFALPDLRGRIPVHQGTGSGGIGTYAIGETGGVESLALTVNQIPQHSHVLAATTNPGKATDPTGNVIAQGEVSCTLFAPAKADTTYSPAHVGYSGGSGTHENRQPYVAINYIIALAGLWPSQG